MHGHYQALRCLHYTPLYTVDRLLFVFSLIHSIMTRIIKLAASQSTLALAPALVETYSRLLVYMEIESLGIKSFIGKRNSVVK